MVGRGLTLATLCFLFAAKAPAQDGCHAFGPPPPPPPDANPAFSIADREAALDAVRELQELESSADWWRAWNGRSERTDNVQLRKDAAQLRMLLLLEETNAAIRLLSLTFQRVELTVALLRQPEKYLEIEASSPRAIDDLVGAQPDEWRATLSREYGRYVYFRQMLEEMIENGDATADVDGFRQGWNADEQGEAAAGAHAVASGASAANPTPLAASAKKVYSRLGLNDIARLFPALELPTERLPLATVQNAFRASPKTRALMMRRKRRQELWTSLKIFSLNENGLAFIEALVAKLPAQAADQARKILSLARSQRAWLEYSVSIQRVLDAPKERRLGLLRTLNASTKQDLLLVYFASADVDEAQLAWIELMREAKKRASEAGEEERMSAAFVARMQAAEERAEKLATTFSLIYDESGSSKLSTVVWCLAGGAAGYFCRGELADAFRWVGGIFH